MAFLKRLGFYLIGLSIGLVFLSYFLKGKAEEAGVEFCYFPNCRVLKDIRSKPLTYSDDIQLLINNKTLDSTQIDYFLKEGSIDFGQSDTKSDPCKTYRIKSKLEDKEAFLTVVNCAKKAIVKGYSYR